MLLRAEEKDIATYAALAYACALQGNTSSYPCYADGIKTKADFLTAAHRANDRTPESGTHNESMYERR